MPSKSPTADISFPPHPRARRVVGLLGALLCFVLLWGLALVPRVEAAPAAQEPQDLPESRETGPETPPSLEDSVAEIHRTLERLVELLERQVDVQQLDVGLKRLDLLSGRLERSERELRGLRANRVSQEGEKNRLEGVRAQTLRLVESGDADASEEERQLYFQELDQQIRRVEGEIAELDRQILRLENEIAELREDLRGWRDFVDRRLGGL